MALQDFLAWFMAAGSINLLFYCFKNPYPRLQTLFPAEVAGISSCTPLFPGRQGEEDLGWDKIAVKSCTLRNETKTLAGAGHDVFPPFCL